MALKQANPLGHFLARLTALVAFEGLFVGLIFWLGLGDSVGWFVLLISAGVLLAAVILTLRKAMRYYFTGRALLGVNVVCQSVLAALFLFGLNFFSFFHYQRYDWTRGQLFTIDQATRAQLSKLRGQTDIVVYLRHSSQGQGGEFKADNYYAAAQRKIMEKVRDLAEMFSDLGPRFHVDSLDIKEDDYARKLKVLQEKSPLLAEAIEKAPENSVFFFSKDQGEPRVQRLSFNDIYTLDRKASEEAAHGKGNLVLYSQGLSPFANKVLNIEEKKPRVGFAVVHEILGVEGNEEYGMPGVKKALASRGYDSRDIILKSWQGGPEPTVLTHDENKYDGIEAQLGALERGVKELEDDEEEFLGTIKLWKHGTLEDINKVWAIADFPQGRNLLKWETLKAMAAQQMRLLPRTFPITEERRVTEVEDDEQRLAAVQEDLKATRKRRDALLLEKAGLSVDNLQEQRRLTDLRAKFNRLTADVDLLVVPRMTLFNLVRSPNERIPYEAHKLDEAQVKGLKDFLKTGKPVLFLLGPTNEPTENPIPLKDDVEDILSGLGVALANQTILYEEEAQAMADRQARKLMLAGSVDIPPVDLEGAVSSGVGRGKKAKTEAPWHPVRTSLKVTGRGFGKKQPSDLVIRQARPVYRLVWEVPADDVQPVAASMLGWPAGGMGMGPFLAGTAYFSRARQQVDEKAVLFPTASRAWNEDQPFPSARGPRFEKPKPDDPNKGTILERRKGGIPIGAAFETSLPSDWFKDDPGNQPAKVRLAVIGHGGVFIGENLPPMKEKLLLDLTNWLLGRDNLLARDQETWSYPRVELSERCANLWKLGAWFGLPLAVFFVGMVVSMVRRMW